MRSFPSRRHPQGCSWDRYHSVRDRRGRDLTYRCSCSKGCSTRNRECEWIKKNVLRSPNELQIRSWSWIRSWMLTNPYARIWENASKDTSGTTPSHIASEPMSYCHVRVMEEVAAIVEKLGTDSRMKQTVKTARVKEETTDCLNKLDKEYRLFLVFLPSTRAFLAAHSGGSFDPPSRPIVSSRASPMG